MRFSLAAGSNWINSSKPEDQDITTGFLGVKPKLFNCLTAEIASNPKLIIYTASGFVDMAFVINVEYSL